MGDRGAGSQSGLQGGPIEIRPGASGPLQQSKRPEKLKVRNELGFADAYKKFSATGKTSLRRHQFDLAKKGNAAMLIWLGKQYLGQSDKPITEEHEEEANVDQLSNLLCSVQEIAVREQISERDAALRLADNLDIPELAATLREWAAESALQQAQHLTVEHPSLDPSRNVVPIKRLSRRH